MMDDYSASLGIPQTSEIGSIGQKPQTNQQPDKKKKKKKRKRKKLLPEDQAIIAGKTLSPHGNRKQPEENPPRDKGELIDIQV